MLFICLLQYEQWGEVGGGGGEAGGEHVHRSRPEELH